MKKVLSILLAVTLLITAFNVSFADEAETSAKMGLGAYIETVESVETLSVPMYVMNTENAGEIELLILNGLQDIPYVSLNDMVEVVKQVRLLDYDGDFPNFSLTITDEGNGIVFVTRDNGAAMVIDTDAGTVSFTDVNLFARMPGAANGLDLNFVAEPDPQYDVTLYRTSSILYREKSALEYRLNDYDIYMHVQDGKVYLPLQTFSDILLSTLNVFSLYNRQCVIVTDGIAGRSLVDEESIWKYTTDVEGMTEEELETERAALHDWVTMFTAGTSFDFARMYYSGEAHEKALEFSVFSYNELCMALDHNYGLQEEHQIDSFDSFFKDTGVATVMLEADAFESFIALRNVVDNYLADGHSGVRTLSYMTEYTKERYLAEKNYGSNTISSADEKYGDIRRSFYPEGISGYEEVGNTAIITFDKFTISTSDFSTYYSKDITSDASDTMELLIYANRQINREGSPVERVVIDLTKNSGGLIPSAVCLVSWILGKCDLQIEDPITGVQAIVRHEFDVNLDHVIDEQDCLLTANTNIKGVYCLISSCSFSCANLVTASLKGDPNVTVIGKTSGGGACVVKPLSTAAGETFQISSAKRTSTVKNGIFYSVDEGVTPDIYVDDFTHLYDRQYLVDMINNLN